MLEGTRCYNQSNSDSPQALMPKSATIRARVCGVHVSVPVIILRTHVPHAVFVNIPLVGVGDERAVVVDIEDSIVVGVVIAHVTDSVCVGVTLVAVRDGGAVVQGVQDRVSAGQCYCVSRGANPTIIYDELYKLSYKTTSIYRIHDVIHVSRFFLFAFTFHASKSHIQ